MPALEQRSCHVSKSSSFNSSWIWAGMSSKRCGADVDSLLRTSTSMMSSTLFLRGLVRVDPAVCSCVCGRGTDPRGDPVGGGAWSGCGDKLPRVMVLSWAHASCRCVGNSLAESLEIAEGSGWTGCDCGCGAVCVWCVCVSVFGCGDREIGSVSLPDLSVIGD